MGQQLAVPTGFNVHNEGFIYPSWYNSHFDVRVSTVRECHETLKAFSSGDMEISQRIQKFDPSSTPMSFMFRQLFNRLLIMSPAFIRRCLNISDTSTNILRADDILKTDFAKVFFNDIVVNVFERLSVCTTVDDIDSTYVMIVKDWNSKYEIDAYLCADIGTVLLLVLSDCIGLTFVRSCRSWVDHLSKALKTLLDLNLTQNSFGCFSLRETMLNLHQPYIEWSDGILSTGYLPIDRQHQWLVTILNISLCSFLSIPSFYVIIHVNTGNQVRISISDVLDALHDYAWIHFTEEEALFMNNPYPG
ncbi:hypothetical protein WA538_004585 [Blastocystis sp. DL]